jgi:transcriptional regulator with XRE-family HTH domain
MIKNQLEYSVTKEWAEKFARSLAALTIDEEKRKIEPIKWQSHRDGVLSQLEDFREQIAEYESLIAHEANRPILLKIDDINQLSDILIKARIALKITQKELAYLCDRTEDQIKSYEEKNYHNASFLDFLAVSDALGIQPQEGKFVAKLDEFYQSHLAQLRQSENINLKIPTSNSNEIPPTSPGEQQQLHSLPQHH